MGKNTEEIPDKKREDKVYMTKTPKDYCMGGNRTGSLDLSDLTPNVTDTFL